MKNLTKVLFFILTVIFYREVNGQYIYISLVGDSNTVKKKCDIYFSGLKNGVILHSISTPTKNYFGLKCPPDTSFEVVLDCWESQIVLDKIYAKCGDSLVVNLGNRTFLLK
jgi:hypothetical protein